MHNMLATDKTSLLFNEFPPKSYVCLLLRIQLLKDCRAIVSMICIRDGSSDRRYGFIAELYDVYEIAEMLCSAWHIFNMARSKTDHFIQSSVSV